MPNKTYSQYILITIAAVCVLLGLVFIFIDSRPPGDFKANTIVHIDSDMPLSAVGNLLVTDHVIRSAFLFHVAVIIAGGEHSAGAGDYLFATSASLWNVTDRIVHDKEGLPLVKIFFPEGTSVHGMAEILQSAFTDSAVATGTVVFNAGDFLALASTSEGYLFPDTYSFEPNITTKAVIAELESNFYKKIGSINSQIVESTRSFHDIVIMASILEKEAATDADRRIIAGILWKKIDEGLPLQIDPPFAYAIGKTSDQLTEADLEDDSPYNTYKYKGLPPTPINNPGLEALTAAVNPTATNYFFYLSDSSGVMHYAATYTEHLANRVKYLGK